jgi:hypothetical protein
MWAKTLVKVAEEIPQYPTKEQIAAFTPAIPHLEEVATNLVDAVTDEDLITPPTRIGWFYEGQGLYALAEPWSNQSLEVVKATGLTQK